MSVMPYEKMIDEALLSMKVEVSEEQKQIILNNVLNVDNIVCSINGSIPEYQLRSSQVIGFIIFYSLKELKLI